ncbi:MAG TPA: VOC family protein [Trueperaceae bacterium]
MPDRTHVGTVTLQVADLDRSLEFYRGVIGFRLLSRGEGTARLGAAGSEDALLELKEKPGARPAARNARLGIYHFAVLLPSRADLGRFLRHAYASGARIGQADHLYSEATYLTDPDGIDLEVYRDRPRDEWTLAADGEIIGSTEPLDLEGVAAAAGAEPWAGLPQGTTMGHMHFFVGDLVKAEEFYHRTLGLDKVTWHFPGALFLSAGGYHHHVGANVWAAGSRPSGPDDARLLTWELRLPGPEDVAAVASRLRAAGYPVTEQDGTFLADDPWGITVSLSAEGAIATA